MSSLVGFLAAAPQPAGLLSTVLGDPSPTAAADAFGCAGRERGQTPLVCDVASMNADLERRALAAACAVAGAHGLAHDDAVIISAGSNVLVHLRPAPVVARVMTGTVALHDDPQLWLERELSVLSFLEPSGIAVAPSSEITLGPHQYDGLWMIFTEWVPDVRPRSLGEASRLGGTLHALHDELKTFTGDLGGSEVLRQRNERLLQQLQPDVVGAETIASLRSRLDGLDELMSTSALPSQPLHGDISLGNLLHTPRSPVWNDFEDAFRGPPHWDVASLVMSCRAEGATSGFVKRALGAYGWRDEHALAPFYAAHAICDEIWETYDLQRGGPATQ